MKANSKKVISCFEVIIISRNFSVAVCTDRMFFENIGFIMLRSPVVVKESFGSVKNVADKCVIVD